MRGNQVVKEHMLWYQVPAIAGFNRHHHVVIGAKCESFMRSIERLLSVRNVLINNVLNA